jgi:hypothetical protein
MFQETQSHQDMQLSVCQIQSNQGIPISCITIFDVYVQQMKDTLLTPITIA